MSLHVQPTSINGLFEIIFHRVADHRGSITEFCRESEFLAAGLPSLGSRPQVNVTTSGQWVVRGIHAEAVHKLITVVQGEIMAVIVDLGTRRWERFYLHPGQGLFVSKGLGNSFQTLSRSSTYLYCFDQEWHPGMEGRACNPFDPALGIWWFQPAVISDKDRNAPYLEMSAPTGT